MLIASEALEYQTCHCEQPKMTGNGQQMIQTGHCVAHE